MKKSRYLGVLYVAATLLIFVLMPVVTYASGSGAGLQASANTSAAILNVKNANSVAEVEQATQGFLDQYGVQYINQEFPNTSLFTSESVTEVTQTYFKDFSIQLIEEWSKYPVAWVADSGLESIYAIGKLNVVGAGNSAKRCASMDQITNAMLYDVSCAYADIRHIIHHEYAHFLIYEKFGSYTFDSSVWSSYNPSGFVYGSGGASSYGDPDFQNTDHPSESFVTAYAKAGLEEDQAEVYGYLFETSNYDLLLGWVGSDQALSQKVDRMKQFMLSVDPSMDDDYFTAAHNYARDTNSEVVYVDNNYPGVKTTNSDGTVLWQISEELVVTSGFSVPLGTTLVLNGSISGGTMSGVVVENGATLKGTGLSESFILVDIGGVLAPGLSPGCLTTNSLTVNGTYQVELNGSVRCTEYDSMNVIDSVVIDNAQLEISMQHSSSVVGTEYIIIDNRGTQPIDGVFSGLEQGAVVQVSGYSFQVDYKGGDGNDVVLRVMSAANNGASNNVGAPNTGYLVMGAKPLNIFILTTSAAIVILFIDITKRRLHIKSW